MTPTELIRKGLMGAAILSLAGCGMVESDPNRFEALAERVGDIRLSADASGAAPRADGLRPALRVEVLDPHALWDARDGALRGFVETAAPAAAEAAAPVLVHAVAEQLRPARDVPDRNAVSDAAAEAHGVIQLGAFSSEASARAAWDRLSAGAARTALSGLSPIYEPVAVNGRDLVRLKVAASASSAAEICRAAQVSDPWCRRAGRA